MAVKHIIVYVWIFVMYCSHSLSLSIYIYIYIEREIYVKNEIIYIYNYLYTYEYNYKYIYIYICIYTLGPGTWPRRYPTPRRFANHVSNRCSHCFETIFPNNLSDHVPNYFQTHVSKYFNITLHRVNYSPNYVKQLSIVLQWLSHSTMKTQVCLLHCNVRNYKIQNCPIDSFKKNTK